MNRRELPRGARRRSIALVTTLVFASLALSQNRALPQGAQPAAPGKAPPAYVKQLRANFVRRAESDEQRYGKSRIAKIEATYQIANKSPLSSPAAREALQKVMAECPGCNRAGCACVYLGQSTPGLDGIRYLRLAMEKYGDCWWGDGAQVGPMAAYFLVRAYEKAGAEKEAVAMAATLVSKYPGAIDHSQYYLKYVLKRQ